MQAVQEKLVVRNNNCQTTLGDQEQDEYTTKSQSPSFRLNPDHPSPAHLHGRNIHHVIIAPTSPKHTLQYQGHHGGKLGAMINNSLRKLLPLRWMKWWRLSWRAFILSWLISWGPNYPKNGDGWRRHPLGFYITFYSPNDV